MQRAYKVELDPNNKQRGLLLKFAGTSRFAWNWGLNQRNELYKNNIKTNAIKQHRDINILKADEFKWMYEISKCVPQEALRDLDRAFSHFFKKTHSFPKFKKRNKSKDSFRLTGSISIEKNRKVERCIRKTRKWIRRTGKNHTCSKSCRERMTASGIQLPRLGIIRLKEIPEFKESTHIQSATVSRTADKWYVSLSVSETDIERELNEDPKIVGIDLGINSLGVLSDGTVYDNPKHLKSNLRSYKKLSKSLSRKIYRSKNWYRAKIKLSKKHRKIADGRKDCLHKMTSEIVKNYDIIILEDLNVKGMVKNRKLSRTISDAGWGELRRMLEYKSDTVVVIPRFYPSSKLCSNCWNKKKDLSLADRVYRCDNCGLEMDRDLNAAINIKIYGLMYYINPMVADSWTETLNACGEGIRPSDILGKMMATSMKHEDVF